MDNNETMRRLRWALSLDDRDATRLMGLGGLEVRPERAAAWRLRDEHEGHAPCPDEAVGALLDGLVRERRGPSPGKADDASPTPAPTRRDNNAVLKALRIALRLRGEDIAALVTEGIAARAAGEDDADARPGPSDRGEPRLSASEVGSLLRAPGTRNYRRCGDQVLRRFLTGLGARTRDATPDGRATPGGPDAAAEGPDAVAERAS